MMMGESIGAAVLVFYSAPVLFGVFCAYWSMENGRNPWLWFFFGLVLSPVAAFALLAITADKRQQLRHPQADGKQQSRADLLAVRKDVF